METTPKPERNKLPLGLVMTVVILCMMAGAVLGHVVTAYRFERKAIQNGAAYHDPQTGQFTWIERPAIVIRKTRVIQEPDGSIHKEEMEDN